jgi:excisionase family DNA binding protein
MRTNPDGLTTAQAAAVLGVSKRTVIRMIEAGEVPAERTPGGHARVKLAHVAAIRDGADLPGGPSAA